MEFQVRYLAKFLIFSVIDNFWWFWMGNLVVLGGKSSQEYSINARVPQGSTLGPTLFLLDINDLTDDICNIAVYSDDTTLYS